MVIELAELFSVFPALKPNFERAINAEFALPLRQPRGCASGEASRRGFERPLPAILA